VRNCPVVIVGHRTSGARAIVTVQAPAAGRISGSGTDLSFISLVTVAPVLAGELATVGADLVLLVKPQFEAGVREAGRGRGVIRDPVVWRRVLDEVGTALSGAGAAMMGVMVSPLTGASGNVEFLAHCRAHAAGPRDIDPAVLDRVVEEAARR